MRKVLLFVFLVATGWTVSPLSRGQTTTATISGVLTDETGAVLPGTQVTVTNVDTGIKRSATADERGRFTVPQLPPGPYEVTASMSGFETLVRKGITLAVGQEANLPLSMKIGSVTEQVTVTGEAPVVNTSSSSVSGVVEEKRIAELPLNGRDFTQLALVQPGVLLARKTDTVGTKGFGTRIAIAGSQVNQTGWLLDGTNIKGAATFGVPGSASGLILGVDAVREFQVLTTNFGAEFGNTSGGIINMVTRSGTNEFHGSAYEFLRNDNFDAANFFTNAANLEKAEFKRNQLGGSLGGPIQKDKLFFFGNYEGLRERLGITRIGFVPDENAHRGLIPAPGGGLEQVEIAPSTRPFLDTFPLPNGPNVGGGIATLFGPSSQPTNEDYFVVRGDYRINDNQTIFGRFTFDSGEQESPNPIPLTSQVFATESRYSTIQHQYIVTPQFLVSSRIAMNRTNLGSLVGQKIDFPPATHIFTPRLPSSIEIAGASTLAPNLQSDFRNVRNNYQISEDMVYTQGSHTFKFGFDFQKLSMNHDGGSRDFGEFTFASLRDFLTDGQLTNFIVGAFGSSARRSMRQYFYGLYFQDDWRATSTLTLNLGVRYEPYSVPNEKWGRLATFTDWRTATVVDTNIPFFNNTTETNFSPRVGFAWDVWGDGKTAVRGGYSLFFVPIDFPFWRTQTYRNQPFFAQVNVEPPSLAEARAFVAELSPSVLTTKLDPSVSPRVPDWNIRSSYDQKFNLSVQRELPGNVSVTVGYIGGRGVGLWRLDSANTAGYILVNGRQFVPAGQSRPNPNFARMPINYSDAQSFYNGLQVEVKKRFSRGFQFQTAYTWSKTIDDTSTSGVNTDFTEGNSSRPEQPKIDRGLAAFHVEHNFVTNGIWTLPSLGNSGFASYIFGGWQLSGVFTAATGNPETLNTTNFNAPDLSQGGNRQRPDQVGPTNNPVEGTTAGCGNIPAGQKLGTPNLYFDPCAFELPPRGFYGDLGRNTIIGPGLLNFDFSLTKSFAMPISEGSRLQFKADFFNIFNRANFAEPAKDVFNARNRSRIGSAGVITGTATKSREMQFGLKLTF